MFFDLVYECYVDDDMRLGCAANVGQRRRRLGRGGAVKFWALEFVRAPSITSALVRLFLLCLIKQDRRSHDHLRGFGHNEMLERFIQPKPKRSLMNAEPSRPRTNPYPTVSRARLHDKLVTQCCVRCGVHPSVHFSHVMAF